MKCLTTTVLCLLPLAACSGWVVIISPTGVCTSSVDVIPSPTRPPVSRTITTGVTVHGTLSSCHLADEFNVAVSTDGILVVHLSWDAAHATRVSSVNIDGKEFRSGSPNWAPLVARVPATQGRQYRLRVALQGSEDIPENRYQLTTSME